MVESLLSFHKVLGLITVPQKNKSHERTININLKWKIVSARKSTEKPELSHITGRNVNREMLWKIVYTVRQSET